jgi:hypothetical protein
MVKKKLETLIRIYASNRLVGRIRYDREDSIAGLGG